MLSYDNPHPHGHISVLSYDSAHTHDHICMMSYDSIPPSSLPNFMPSILYICAHISVNKSMFVKPCLPVASEKPLWALLPCSIPSQPPQLLQCFCPWLSTLRKVCTWCSNHPYTSSIPCPRELTENSNRVSIYIVEHSVKSDVHISK